jgi:hypothetical protein
MSICFHTIFPSTSKEDDTHMIQNYIKYKKMKALNLTPKAQQ